MMSTLELWKSLALVALLTSSQTLAFVSNLKSNSFKRGGFAVAQPRFSSDLYKSSSNTEQLKTSTPPENSKPKIESNKQTAKEQTKDEQDKDKKAKVKPVAVLVCPAQFCVPADYEAFLHTLQQNAPPNLSISSSSRVARLPRTEWIKVTKQILSTDFFSANLDNSKTLSWYFDAIDQGLADILSEAEEDLDDLEICIIGHSIGGWVARSYLGGLGRRSTSVYRSTLERCRSLVTLGTPHKSPETALVDQTRGLLRAVEETEGCSAEGLAKYGISVTCVGGTSVEGKFLTNDLEEIVATTSYLPLVGDWTKVLKGEVTGDGIIPRDLAFMDGCAKRVEVEKCSITGNNVRHAHVLPTPYNLWAPAEPSISLPEEFCWYGSEGVIDQWIDYI